MGNYLWTSEFHPLKLRTDWVQALKLQTLSLRIGRASRFADRLRVSPLALNQSGDSKTDIRKGAPSESGLRACLSYCLSMFSVLSLLLYVLFVIWIFFCLFFSATCQPFSDLPEGQKGSNARTPFICSGRSGLWPQGNIIRSYCLFPSPGYIDR